MQRLTDEGKRQFKLEMAAGFRLAGDFYGDGRDFPVIVEHNGDNSGGSSHRKPATKEFLQSLAHFFLVAIRRVSAAASAAAAAVGSLSLPERARSGPRCAGRPRALERRRRGPRAASSLPTATPMPLSIWPRLTKPRPKERVAQSAFRDRKTRDVRTFSN